MNIAFGESVIATALSIFGQTSTLVVYRACDAIVLVIINSDVCVHKGNRLVGS